MVARSVLHPGAVGAAPLRGVSLTNLYRINDLLDQQDQTIQHALFQKERTLFNLPETIVFYDLTNTFYHGKAHGEYLAYGRSKQKRSDCPLVTLGLVLDGAGFPRTCEVLPGNVSEPGTLKKAMERLETTVKDHKPSIVMDAGIATEANIRWLAAHGYPWICVHRGRRPLPPEREPDETLRTQANYQVRAWKLKQTESETQLYIVSEGRRHKEEQIAHGKRTRFEEKLQKLHDGLSKPYHMKRLNKVTEKVGRLKEQYKRISAQYEITVKKGADSKAKAVTWVRKAQAEQADDALGGYVLRTSHTDWSLQNVITTYWRLNEVEATFRSLKSELGLRPLHHFKDERIAAHLNISVYAYHGVHLIRTRLKAEGIHLSWQSLRQQLSQWRRVTTTIRDVEGRQIENRQDERPSPALAKIARIVGVTPAIHRQRTVR